MKTPQHSIARRPLFAVAFALLLLTLALAALPSPPAVAGRLAAEPVTWQQRHDAYPGNTYAAAPAIAARPQNGMVFLGWQEKDVNAQADEILAASNEGLGTGFDDVDALDSGGYQLLGNVSMAHDSLGRVHMAWFRQGDSGVEIKYARTNTAGTGWEINTAIPVARSSLDNPRKNVALTVGPDNRVHLLWGREEVDVFYTFTDNGVNWASGSRLPFQNMPKDLAIAVSTNNVVMAAWIDRGPNSRGEVLAATRNGDGSWTAFNISQPVGSGGSNTYWPRLTRDNTGGIRAVWADEDVHLRTSEQRGPTDIYYREWGPGGWSPNVYQVVSNPGESQQPDIRVDATNTAHIVWMDDTGRNFHNYTLRYSTGGPSGFTPSRLVVPDWDDAQNKDPALDWANNQLHLAFSSTIDDPQRDNYYTWGQTQGLPPTATPTRTNTPQPTPTLAPCTFYDVAQSDYFYQPVRYLCDRDAISGYADGTFRPFNSATRGQIAKIVVVAEGWPINTSGGPHFRDVLPDNPFYNWIETAYGRRIISGYNCGTGCLEFRWGNNVTRGQLAKIIVEAESWAIDTGGGPHFRDVPRNNPFYDWIETAYNREIIAGYSCGAGCMEFRWNLPATRGQIAKIVHGAVTRP